MKRLENCSAETLDKVRGILWAGSLEINESPVGWGAVLDDDEEPPELLEVEGRDVLLPIPCSHHKNMKMERVIWSADGKSLTLFLRDSDYNGNGFSVGFVAVCDLLDDIFVAILFYGWFLGE